MTEFHFIRWDGRDGLVRQAVLAETREGEPLNGVTQALSDGVWVQCPVDIFYEGRSISREQARADFPGVDPDAPVTGYEEGYLSGDVRRDPIIRPIWDMYVDATEERRDLTLAEAREAAWLLRDSRRRYAAAMRRSLRAKDGPGR